MLLGLRDTDAWLEDIDMVCVGMSVVLVDELDCGLVLVYTIVVELALDGLDDSELVGSCVVPGRLVIVDGSVVLISLAVE